MDTRAWSSIPAQRSSKDTLKTRRRIVWAVLLGILFLGPASCMFSLAAAGGSSKSGSGSTTTVQASAAQAVASAFLNGQPSPIGVTSDVDPLLGTNGSGTRIAKIQSLAYGGTTVVPNPSETSDAVWYRSTFWATTPQGLTYALTVTTTPGAGGPVLAALPSISTVSTSSADDSQTLTLNGSPTAVDIDAYPGLQDRIMIWATAYGAADVERLVEISKDGPTATTTLGSPPRPRYDGAPSDDVIPSIVYTPGNLEVQSMMEQEDGSLLALVSVDFTHTATKATLGTTMELVIIPDGTDGSLSTISQWGPPGSASAQ